MIPLIAAAGVVQMAMLTGGYGDNDVSIMRVRVLDFVSRNMSKYV